MPSLNLHVSPWIKRKISGMSGTKNKTVPLPAQTRGVDGPREVVLKFISAGGAVEECAYERVYDWKRYSRALLGCFAASGSRVVQILVDGEVVFEKGEFVDQPRDENQKATSLQQDIRHYTSRVDQLLCDVSALHQNYRELGVMCISNDTR